MTNEGDAVKQRQQDQQPKPLQATIQPPFNKQSLEARADKSESETCCDTIVQRSVKLYRTGGLALVVVVVLKLGVFERGGRRRDGDFFKVPGAFVALFGAWDVVVFGGFIRVFLVQVASLLAKGTFEDSGADGCYEGISGGVLWEIEDETGALCAGMVDRACGGVGSAV
jgi:hypothetical protein